MKLATRKAVGTGAQRRLQLQSARASSPALRDRFPQVATLRFELRFEVPDSRAPSPQQHTLYPAARAFFRFACPCSECDGDFDLGPAVVALVGGLSESRRAETGAVSGRMSCEGWRARDRAGGRPCTSVLEYRLSAGVAGPD